MSKSIKVFGLVGLMVLVAACGSSGNNEEVVIVDPEPISVEPVNTGKFK